MAFLLCYIKVLVFHVRYINLVYYYLDYQIWISTKSLYEAPVEILDKLIGGLICIYEFVVYFEMALRTYLIFILSFYFNANELNVWLIGKSSSMNSTFPDTLKIWHGLIRGVSHAMLYLLLKWNWVKFSLEVRFPSSIWFDVKLYSWSDCLFALWF